MFSHLIVTLKPVCEHLKLAGVLIGIVVVAGFVVVVIGSLLLPVTPENVIYIERAMAITGVLLLCATCVGIYYLHLTLQKTADAVNATNEANEIMRASVEATTEANEILRDGQRARLAFVSMDFGRPLAPAASKATLAVKNRGLSAARITTIHVSRFPADFPESAFNFNDFIGTASFSDFIVVPQPASVVVDPDREIETDVHFYGDQFSEFLEADRRDRIWIRFRLKLQYQTLGMIGEAVILGGLMHHTKGQSAGWSVWVDLESQRSR